MTERVGMAIVDLLVVVLLLVPSALLYRVIERVNERTVELALIDSPAMAIAGVPFLVAFLYLGLSQGRRGERNGQTFAKQLGNVRVVRAGTGLPIGRTRAWLRAAWIALILPSGFPLFVLAQALVGSAVEGKVIGGIVNAAVLLAVGGAALSPGRRTYYDWVFGTAVVADPAAQQPASDSTEMPPSDADETRPRPQVPIPIHGLPADRTAALMALGWLAWVIYYNLSPSLS